jgi:hypothetical protein
MCQTHNSGRGLRKRCPRCFYCGTTHFLTKEHVLPKSLFKHYNGVSKSRLMAMACQYCNGMMGDFTGSYDNIHECMIKPTNTERHVIACIRLMLRIKSYYKDSFYADILLDEIFEMILVFLDQPPLTSENCPI